MNKGDESPGIVPVISVQGLPSQEDERADLVHYLTRRFLKRDVQPVIMLLEKEKKLLTPKVVSSDKSFLEYKQALPYYAEFLGSVEIFVTPDIKEGIEIVSSRGQGDVIIVSSTEDIEVSHFKVVLLVRDNNLSLKTALDLLQQERSTQSFYSSLGTADAVFSQYVINPFDVLSNEEDRQSLEERHFVVSVSPRCFIGVLMGDEWFGLDLFEEEEPLIAASSESLPYLIKLVSALGLSANKVKTLVDAELILSEQGPVITSAKDALALKEQGLEKKNLYYPKSVLAFSDERREIAFWKYLYDRTPPIIARGPNWEQFFEDD